MSHLKDYFTIIIVPFLIPLLGFIAVTPLLALLWIGIVSTALILGARTISIHRHPEHDDKVWGQRYERQQAAIDWWIQKMEVKQRKC